MAAAEGAIPEVLTEEGAIPEVLTEGDFKLLSRHQQFEVCFKWFIRGMLSPNNIKFRDDEQYRVYESAFGALSQLVDYWTSGAIKLQYQHLCHFKFVVPQILSVLLSETSGDYVVVLNLLPLRDDLQVDVEQPEAVIEALRAEYKRKTAGELIKGLKLPDLGGSQCSGWLVPRPTNSSLDAVKESKIVEKAEKEFKLARNPGYAWLTGLVFDEDGLEERDN